MTAIAIPVHIWEQDQSIWKAWITSVDTYPKTKQQYKRCIINFYDAFQKPIRDVTEDDLMSYELGLQAAGLSANTVKRYITPVRAYWKFAHKQPQHA